MSNTWSEENNKILFDSFNDYLKNLTKVNGRGHDGLELFITPYCNQACEYCYLVKNSEKLYPHEIAKPDQILKNLDILLDYLAENNYYPTSFDLYSGEIWETPLGLAVLKRMVEFCKNSNGRVKKIMIPSNFSFILNDKVRPIIEDTIAALKYYDCNLILSCSYDGPIIEEDNRPFVGRDTKIKTTEEYIEFLFDWCEKYNYGFHPMVNAHSIEKWDKQVEWWIDQILKRDWDLYQLTMFLEVRNDEWTDDKIKSYLKYLNTLIEATLHKVHEDDLEDYIRTALRMPLGKNFRNINYNTQNFAVTGLNKGCGIDRMMSIRLGDLAWVPCHRLSYEKLLFGRLAVENNKIVGMEALNIPLFVGINSLSYKGHMKCDICPINEICHRGCYGSQFETHKELYYPCETVCNLYKAKNLFLREKYSKLYFNNKEVNSIPNDLKNKFNQLSAIVDKLPKEDYDRWIPTISELI